MRTRFIGLLAIAFMTGPVRPSNAADMDTEFEKIGERYIAQVTEFSPVQATGLGDHRFDGELDDISPETRERQKNWIQKVTAQLAAIKPDRLSRRHQVDWALMNHSLNARLWRLTVLREWSWNPLIYTGIAGDSLYGLMARDFAPERQRLNNAAKRLEPVSYTHLTLPTNREV